MSKGVRVWTCDGCGKRETWRKGWGYLHGVESLANVDGRPGFLMPLATCSDACVDAALEKTMVSR